MSRLAKRFSDLHTSGRKALISYITAGDPGPETTLELMHEMVAGGVDVLELGVPFSDPVADGPTIQKACERALHGGMTLRGVLDIVRQFRRVDTQTPVVLMGYLNPIEMMGYAEFVDLAKAAGVDGVLVVDMPPEESAAFTVLMRASGLDQIFMLTPTSTLERIRQVNDKASGFVYYVSLKGVTGTTAPDPVAVAAKLDEIRHSCHHPLAVGFGITDAASARAIARSADGVVVGSALVRLIESCPNQREELMKRIRALVTELRTALDQPPSS